MIWIVGVILLFVLACFSFVLLFGAPYLPTLKVQVSVALDLADLQPGQLLLELGCGDGKVLIAAARRGWRAVGFELNPLLVIICKLRTWRYRRLVQVHWGNFWTLQWPPADAIFIFGLQRIMPKLDKKIMQSLSGPVNPAAPNQDRVKLVSFTFQVPGRQPVRQKQGVLLYDYHV